MALRPEYSLVQSEFNDFLFSFVGEEKNGIQLTVLSALARLGLDPWREAARLSELTKEAATSALANAIASFPNGDWKASDARAIATRLVGRLPKHLSSPPDSAPDGNIERRSFNSEFQNWLTWIAVALAVFLLIRRLFGD